MPKVYAIDTETYYDKTVSVKTYGAEAYTRHPDYYCGMVSIVGPDVRYVGKPADAPWHKLAGAVWVAHNVQFDRWVINRMRQTGEVPDVWPSRWVDTTAIPAYLQVSRDLASAAKVLLGQAADKTVRTQMSGKHFKDLPEVKWKLLCDYALKDAELCYQLYQRYHNQLPQHEWDLSELTVDQADYGVQVNRTLLEDYLANVQLQELQLLDLIPWRGDMPALSQAALRRTLLNDGAVDCPKTTRADDQEWFEWSQKNAEKYPYVEAFVQLRRLKKHLSTLQNIQNRLDTDGVLHYSLKYCGSRLTGRWAGDAGINMQNLTKGEHFGTNIRHLFTPRNGHKFIVADLSQIEPRCLAALAGDTEFLGNVAKGMDCYEAHARSSKGYTDPRPLKDIDPDLRQICKGEVLGMGYGIGPVAYQAFAKNLGLNYTEEESKKAVSNYRKQNPKIVGLWNLLDGGLRQAFKADRILTIPLVSGRKLNYWDVGERTLPKKTRKCWSATVERGKGKIEFLWGSKLVENLVQATARDVFADAMLRIDKGGIKTLWHVHDELICEVPEDQAQDALEFVTEQMSQRYHGLPDMPLGVDAHIANYYDK